MKRLFAAVCIIMLSLPVLAQDGASVKIYKSRNPGEQGLGIIEFIAQVSSRDRVTCGDALNFFVMVIGREPGTFDENKAALKTAGIDAELGMGENDPVRKGDVALMAAEYLKLGDLAMYAIFKTKRYAFRACVANGIMDYAGSEWDRMSGAELIEVMNRVSRRAESK
ncbi:MAG TPA: hypothetical protein PKJ16_13965 [Spirochaetota bacterium]|nr:hypothetical protein [Spirochaetota bacterium]HOS41027.1 hypothetical protein [Spirochaetota bacterium]HPU88703.1 hypothetical protein [Spirochaetota bacterium]